MGVKKQTTNKILIYVALLVVSTFYLFPFYWMIMISFHSAPISRTIQWIPKRIDLTSYKKVLFWTPFFTWFKNSLIVASATTTISVVVSLFAAYALSRFKFLLRDFSAIALVLFQLLPGILLAIPLYVLLTKVRLINMYPGLILTYLTFALPFSIWMLWGYFDSIPKELEESAMIDGCGRIGAIFRIILPLSVSGIGAVIVYTFCLALQEYLFALLIMTSDSMLTLPVGIARFVDYKAILWDQLMAIAVMVTIPMAVFFVYLQKFLVQGLTAGAIKG